MRTGGCLRLPPALTTRHIGDAEMTGDRIIPINRELKEFMRVEFDRLQARLDRVIAVLGEAAPADGGPADPPFNTLAAAMRLEAGGFTQEQARALVYLLRDIVAGKAIRYPDEDKP